MSAATIEHRRFALQAWRASQQAKGLCIHCADGKPKPGAKSCAACLAKIAKSNHRRLNKRSEQGLCYRCDAMRAPGKKHCRDCLAELTQAQQRRKQREGSNV